MSSSPEANRGFANIPLADLEQMNREEVDQLPFGVVGLSSDGLVEVYNAAESRLAGIPADTVMGTPFFLSVAQCMNNFMVAQRLTDEAELDATLPYILTFRMIIIDQRNLRMCHHFTCDDRSVTDTTSRLNVR